MLRIAVPGDFPALLFNFWRPLERESWSVSLHNNRAEVLVKIQIPSFSYPLEVLIQERETRDLYFNKLFSSFAFKEFRYIWFMAHSLDQQMPLDVPCATCPSEHSAKMEMFYICSDTVANSHVWLLSTRNVASVREALNFLIFISF